MKRRMLLLMMMMMTVKTAPLAKVQTLYRNPPSKVCSHDRHAGGLAICTRVCTLCREWIQASMCRPGKCGALNRSIVPRCCCCCCSLPIGSGCLPWTSPPLMRRTAAYVRFVPLSCLVPAAPTGQAPNSPFCRSAFLVTQNAHGSVCFFCRAAQNRGTERVLNGDQSRGQGAHAVWAVPAHGSCRALHALSAHRPCLTASKLGRASFGVAKP